MKTTLILVRHAEAEGNIKREFHGWTDGDITEKGHIQALKVSQALKPVDIDVIYSSSLQRTLQTAEYIAQAKNLPIIRTERLKEIHGGDWEKRKWEDLPHIWPREYETWEKSPHTHQMPNGESMKEFQKRLVEEIQNIINTNKQKRICIVTHGTAIKALMCYFNGCDLKEMLNIIWYDNTSVTIVEYDHTNNIFHVLQEGDASHLGKELSTIQNQEWWIQYQEDFKARKNNTHVE